jgi:hypothetical protein
MVLPPGLPQAVIGGMVWLAVLAGLAVYFLVRAAARRSAKKKYSGEMPSCMSCGYSLQVRTSDRCPECGADLTRPRAIHLPGEPAPLPWPVRIFVMTLIVAYPLVTPVALIDANGKMQDWFYGYEAFELATPASDQYYKVIIDAQWFHVGTWTKGTLTAQLLGVRGVHHPTGLLTVSLPALRATFAVKGESKRRHRMPIDSTFVLDWMREQGVAVDAPGVQAEATRICQEIERFSVFGYGSGRNRYGPGQRTYPLDYNVFQSYGAQPWKPWNLWWYWPVAIIVIGAIWTGLALRVRPRRSSEARPHSPQAPPSTVH